MTPSRTTAVLAVCPTKGSTSIRGHPPSDPALPSSCQHLQPAGRPPSPGVLDQRRWVRSVAARDRPGLAGPGGRAVAVTEASKGEASSSMNPAGRPPVHHPLVSTAWIPVPRQTSPQHHHPPSPLPLPSSVFTSKATRICLRHPFFVLSLSGGPASKPLPLYRLEQAVCNIHRLSFLSPYPDR